MILEFIEVDSHPAGYEESLPHRPLWRAQRVSGLPRGRLAASPVQRGSRAVSPREATEDSVAGIRCIKLAPDPGYFVRVPVGAFRESLRSFDPRWGDRPGEELVDCCIQLYRIIRPCSARTIAFLELGTEEDADRFKVMTREKARLLGLRDSGAGSPESLIYRVSAVAKPAGDTEEIPLDSAGPSDKD